MRSFNLSNPKEKRAEGARSLAKPLGNIVNSYGLLYIPLKRSLWTQTDKQTANLS